MTKIKLSALLGVFTIVALFVSACGVIPEKGWILYQNSPFVGEQIVYISRDGVKSINPQMNITCIVRASSDPKIIYFNDKTKVYCEMGLEEWKADLKRRKAGIDGLSKAMGEPKQKPLKKTGEVEIAGIKATQYTEESEPTAKAPGNKDSELYFANNIAVPQAFHLIAHKPMNVPENNGVLLRMVVTTGDGQKVTALDTTRFERQDLPADTFTAPTGYKRVKNDMEVVMGEGAGQAMEGLFKELAKPDTKMDVEHLMKTGDAAGQYADSVRSELHQGKIPHSTKQSQKDMDKFMEMMQGAAEEAQSGR